MPICPCLIIFSSVKKPAWKLYCCRILHCSLQFFNLLFSLVHPLCSVVNLQAVADCIRSHKPYTFYLPQGIDYLFLTVKIGVGNTDNLLELFLHSIAQENVVS